MVKIRYSELPAGLHVSAKPHGRDTIIYLQPGLTAEQRRAALARVRNSGRMGHGPPLSVAGVAMAVSADKLRTTMRNGVAATRGHPLLLLPPLILLVSTAIVLVPMSVAAVTMREHERPAAQRQGLAVTQGQAPAHHRGSGPASPTASPTASPAADSGASGSGRGPSGLAPSPRTGQSPSPSQSRTVVQVLTGPSPSSPVRTPSPSPEPSPDPNQSYKCLKLGLCLTR